MIAHVLPVRICITTSRHQELSTYSPLHIVPEAEYARGEEPTIVMRSYRDSFLMCQVQKEFGKVFRVLYVHRRHDPGKIANENILKLIHSAAKLAMRLCPFPILLHHAHAPIFYFSANALAQESTNIIHPQVASWTRALYRPYQFWCKSFDYPWHPHPNLPVIRGNPAPRRVPIGGAKQLLLLWPEPATQGKTAQIDIVRFCRGRKAPASRQT